MRSAGDRWLRWVTRDGISLRNSVAGVESRPEAGADTAADGARSIIRITIARFHERLTSPWPQTLPAGRHLRFVKAKVLQLREMIVSQRGTIARRLIQVVISIAMRLFFRRIETCGAEFVPPKGPVIIVLNHPNGLID